MRTVAWSERSSAIAIVGIAGRFPRSDGMAGLRETLLEGTDCVRPLSEARRDLLGLAPGAYPETAFIDDLALFDHAMFDVSRAEAAQIDPEQRHLLELSCLALLDAAIAPSSVAGSNLGVFIGCSTGSGYAARLGVDSAFAHTGTMQALSAGRISHWLDCNGPAEVINTACSASLVAVLSAVQALRTGQADRALAGGFNAYCGSSRTVSLGDPLGIRSPGFRCRPFDSAADGIGVGEGGGMVLLMRLEDAMRSGENVHAVIRGGAVSHDGRSPNGLTAPNVAAQRRMYRLAWADAEVYAAAFGYLEAHGTGTYLGDPIEYKALRAELAGQAGTARPPVLGSIKSNFGHLDNAAGVAGLLKCVLSLKNREIYRTVHFDTPNPHMGYAPEVLGLCADTTEWSDDAGPCAGVSAFGLSGTNAHLVLEPAPERGAPGRRASAQLVRISARTADALGEQMRALSDFARELLPNAAVLARTLNAGRDDGPFRASVVVDGAGEVGNALQGRLEAGLPAAPVQPLGLVLLFGNSAPNPALLQAHLDTLPRLPGVFSELGVRPDLAGVSGVQAAFCCQYAMANQLESWGIPIDGIIGTGVGSVSRSVLNGETPLEHALARLGSVEGGRPDRERLFDATRQFKAKGRTAFVAMHEDDELLALVRGFDGPEDLRPSAWFNAEEGPLQRVGRLYEAGLDVDWARFSAENHGMKLTAPPPSLIRTVCWADEDPQEDTEVPAASPRVEFSTRAWQPVASLPGRVEDCGRILVIDESDPLSDALWSEARAAGLDVIRWRLSSGQPDRSDSAYCGPLDADSATFVFDDLKQAGRWPSKVVLSAPPRAATGPPLWTGEWIASVSRVFDLVRTIAKGADGRQAALYLLGAGGSGFSAPEDTDLREVFRRGLGRTIAEEFPNLAVGCIDAAGDRDCRSATVLARQVLQQLPRPIDKGYSCVALCGNQVFAETVSAVAEPEHGVSYRDSLIVLITGGLGGIGLALAVSLAETCKARVALIGRRPLDAFSEDAAQADEISAALDRIREAGGDYLTLAADVCDEKSLRMVRAAIETKWGAVQGIVHAAGVPGGRLIRLISEEGIRDVAGPKLVGIEAISDVFGDSRMDFVALMSSLSTEFGAVGQAEYCAANLVLNEYAAILRRRLGWPAVAIGWDRWDDTGMSRNVAASLAEARAGLQPEEAVAAFHTALATGHATVFVSKSRIADIGRADDKEESGAHAPVALDKGEVTQRLLEVARYVLEVDFVDPAVDLFEYGVDSMELIEIFHVANELAPGRVSIHDVLLEASINEIVDQIFGSDDAVGADDQGSADGLNIVTLDL